MATKSTQSKSPKKNTTSSVIKNVQRGVISTAVANKAKSTANIGTVPSKSSTAKKPVASKPAVKKAPVKKATPVKKPITKAPSANPSAVKKKEDSEHAFISYVANNKGASENQLNAKRRELGLEPLASTKIELATKKAGPVSTVSGSDMALAPTSSPKVSMSKRETRIADRKARKNNSNLVAKAKRGGIKK